MSNSQMDLFVGMSAVLTGIDASMLAPQLDPVNIKQTYFNFVQGKDATTFNQMLGIFQQNQTKPPAVIANIICNQSGTAVEYLARSIMLMWYLGSWYEPAVLQAYNSPNPPPPPVPSAGVISAAAYTQGWVWNVIQAHPMGYSNFVFGDWSKDPPSLADFVGTGGGQP